MSLPIVAEAIYTAREVAEVVFRHTRTWFYRNRARLEREGFPPPISSVGHGRWSGADLLRWERREKASLTTPAPPAANVVDYTALVAARVDRRRRERQAS